MRDMQRAAIGAAMAGAVLAACSTSIHGQPFGPVYTTVSGLGAQMSKASSELTTVRGTLHLDAGSLRQDSAYSSTLAKGTVTALDDQVSTVYQGQTIKIHVIIADGKLYVDRSGQSDRPWVIATPDSSDPLVSSLAANAQATLGQSGMQQYLLMVSAARDLNVVGPETVSGVPCTHYKLTVDTQAAAKTLPGQQGEQMQHAADAGVDTIPLEVWVDSEGHAIRLSDKVTAQGTTASIDLRLGDFDEPVTIKAPPRDQIAGS